MIVNPALENAFGTIGTVLWCIQIIPQIWSNWRRKDVVGLSPWLMLIWATASIFLGAYAIAQNINIPIIVQPQLFGFLATFCWIQCLYYGPPHLSKAKATAILVAYLAMFAGVEAGFVYAIRADVARGSSAALNFFGIFSAIMLCGALLPQYWEIYRFKEVVGLSLVFMSMDLTGAIFCTLSLVFKESFDAVAGANYIGIIVLDGLILVLAAILNPRANRRRKREALETPCETMETTNPPETLDEAERGKDIGLASGVEKVDAARQTQAQATPE